MPFVQIKGVGGYLTIEQKQEMIRRLTDAVLSVGANASGRSHG
jgi:4-oxalocrotonate tautomerase